MKQEIKELLDSITGYNPKCEFTQDKVIANYLIQYLDGFSVERAKEILNTATKLVESQTIIHLSK